MERKHETHKHAATHPANTAGLDTTEEGPSRLFAPGKPREVEAGPSRLGTRTLQGYKKHNTPHQIEGALDETEAGGPRIARSPK